ncbi:MAG: OsmC family protein [Syntrophales bacterium]|nr:OsmC family protein [Syntrophales bacterium]
MADDDKDTLNESLTGYKQNITPVVKAALAWERDLVFTGSTPQGYEIEFDAQAQWGCKPTESLLLSLAGCMSIDIVTILTKMRIQLASFRMEIEGKRNPTPPQYYQAVEMVLHIAGKNLTPGKVERAIALSRDKYCSVFNSLRPDLVLSVRYVLEEKCPPVDDKTP